MCVVSLMADDVVRLVTVERDSLFVEVGAGSVSCVPNVTGAMMVDVEILPATCAKVGGSEVSVIRHNNNAALLYMNGLLLRVTVIMARVNARLPTAVSIGVAQKVAIEGALGKGESYDEPMELSGRATSVHDCGRRQSALEPRSIQRLHDCRRGALVVVVSLRSAELSEPTRPVGSMR